MLYARLLILRPSNIHSISGPMESRERDGCWVQWVCEKRRRLARRNSGVGVRVADPQSTTAYIFNPSPRSQPLPPGLPSFVPPLRTPCL